MEVIKYSSLMCFIFNLFFYIASSIYRTTTPSNIWVLFGMVNFFYEYLAIILCALSLILFIICVAYNRNKVVKILSAIVCLALVVFDALAISIMYSDRDTFAMRKTNKFIGDNRVYAKKVIGILGNPRTDYYISEDGKNYVFISSEFVNILDD